MDELLKRIQAANDSMLSVEEYAAYVIAMLSQMEPRAQTAPVAQDWQPKVGERVLVEVVYRGEPDEDGDVYVSFPYTYNNTINEDGRDIIARSAIVGPAPVRARFAVGDEVFSKSNLMIGEIIAALNNGSWMCQFWDTVGTIYEEQCPDADLLTLDEARERLAKA